MANKSSEATTSSDMSSNTEATTPGENSSVTIPGESEFIDLVSGDGLNELYNSSEDDIDDEDEDQPTSDSSEIDDDDDDEPETDNRKKGKSDDGELSDEVPEDDEDDDDDDDEESEEDQEDDFESDEKVESIIDELIDAADDDQLAARKKKGLLKLYDRQKNELSEAREKLEGIVELESRLNNPELAKQTLQEIYDYYAKHHNWGEDEQIQIGTSTQSGGNSGQNAASLFELTPEEQEVVDEMSSFERRVFEQSIEFMKRRFGNILDPINEIQAEKQSITERRQFNQKIKDSIRGVNKYASENLGFKVSESQLAEAVKAYPNLSMNEAVTLKFAPKIKSSATKAVVTSNRKRIPDMPKSSKTKPRQSKYDSISLVGDVDWGGLVGEP